MTRLAKALFQVSSFKKFSGGVVVACLIIVSTPGPDFVRVKVRFGQRGDIFKIPALKSLVVGGVGWGGVVVACLIIVSTPGPGFVRVKVRFGQIGDEVGLGFVWSSW